VIAQGEKSINAIDRLKDGITPYTRWIRSDYECIDKAISALARLRHIISELRAHSQAVVVK
jgi:hypothetical protein